MGLAPKAEARARGMKGVDEELRGIDPANAALGLLFFVFALFIPAGLLLTSGSPALLGCFVALTLGAVLAMVSQGGGNEKVRVGLSMANNWTDSTAVLILAIPLTVGLTPFVNWLLWSRLGLWAVAAQYLSLIHI